MLTVASEDTNRIRSFPDVGALGRAALRDVGVVIPVLPALA